MKKTVYETYMLRDPVYQDRFWNGVTLVKERVKWKKNTVNRPPERHVLSAIKFEKTGKSWSDRDAALDAHREYQITVAMIAKFNMSSNRDWMKFPASLDMVTVRVTKEHVVEEALPVLEMAEVIAAHRYTNNANQAQTVERMIKHEDAESFKYLVRLPLTPAGYDRADLRAWITDMIRSMNNVGVRPPSLQYPYMALTNRADLLAVRLLFESIEIRDFKTAEVIE